MKIIHSEQELAGEFLQIVESSINSRSLNFSGSVKIYLVSLLTTFAQPKNPLQHYGRPLTFDLQQSLNESNKILKIERLQNIGDLCLFLTGYCPDHILNKGTGQIEYHQGIGSAAYNAIA